MEALGTSNITNIYLYYTKQFYNVNEFINSD